MRLFVQGEKDWEVDARATVVRVRGRFRQHTLFVFRVRRVGAGASSIGARFKLNVPIRADTQDVAGQRRRNYDGIDEKPYQGDKEVLFHRQIARYVVECVIAS